MNDDRRDLSEHAARAFAREDFGAAWRRYDELWRQTDTPRDRLRALDVAEDDFAVAFMSIEHANLGREEQEKLFSVGLYFFGIGLKLGELRATRAESLPDPNDP